MQFAPYPQYPQLTVTVDDPASAVSVVRLAIEQGPGVPFDHDPSQYLAALLGRAPGVARDWLRAAVEQVLVIGTDAERSRILGMFAISDNDWRVRQVKTLIETAPGWLRNPNPHDGFKRPLGALVVEAALGRVVHLHPSLAADIEKHAADWGAEQRVLRWAVKADPDGAGVLRIEAFEGDLSDSAGVLGIVYSGRDEAVVQRVAKKLASASESARQDFLWEVADYESDKAVVARVAATLGLPAP